MGYWEWRKKKFEEGMKEGLRKEREKWEEELENKIKEARQNGFEEGRRAAKGERKRKAN